MAHCDAVGWSRPHHQVDPRQRRGQLPQIGGRGTNDAGELAKGPVCRCHRLFRLRQDQMQPLGAVTRSFDPDIRRLHNARPAPLGPTLDRGPKVIEREIPLVIRPVEPFGRHPPVPLPLGDIHFPATSPNWPNGVQNFHHVHDNHSVTAAGSHSPGLGLSLEAQPNSNSQFGLETFSRIKPSNIPLRT